MDELLKPRIKVIAPMPLMKNKVGEFLYRQEDDKNRFSFGISTGNETHFFKLEDFKEWPYIFHICEWWEERKETEMPEYLKSWHKPVNHNGAFSNVVIKCGVDEFWNSKDFSVKEGFVTGYGGIRIEVFSPATKEEYEKLSK